MSTGPKDRWFVSSHRLNYIENIFSYSPRNQKIEIQIIDFLKKFGFSRQDLIQTKEGRFEQVRVYLSSSTKAQALAKTFEKENLRAISFTQRYLAYKDWAEKWKKDYKIQNLGRSFLIVPAWRVRELKKKQIAKRKPVFIDPLSAFGSGEHETTRLVVRLMELLCGKFDSFIDMGTGTGILSIVAVYCGAKKVLGFDNDRHAVNCARHNFKLNKIENKTTHFLGVELARFRPKERVDLVCANINSHILEKYRKQIVGSAQPGGWVLVSGILHQTYESFRQEFDAADLRCVKVLRGRRWVAILYKKI